MIEVKSNTIVFLENGTLLVFESRDEFAEWAKGKKGYTAWAEPRWLLESLREKEEIIAEYEEETGKYQHHYSGEEREPKVQEPNEIMKRAETAMTTPGQMSLI